MDKLPTDENKEQISDLTFECCKHQRLNKHWMNDKKADRMLEQELGIRWID
jgi:hypothetical protein